ncbi:MAG TPA: hypothetical protein VF077_03985 [Nitrospiraceae bacterium]
MNAEEAKMADAEAQVNEQIAMDAAMKELTDSAAVASERLGAANVESTFNPISDVDDLLTILTNFDKLEKSYKELKNAHIRELDAYQGTVDGLRRQSEALALTLQEGFIMFCQTLNEIEGGNVLGAMESGESWAKTNERMLVVATALMLEHDKRIRGMAWAEAFLKTTQKMIKLMRTLKYSDQMKISKIFNRANQERCANDERSLTFAEERLAAAMSDWLQEKHQEKQAEKAEG